jgi:hypothetical protein
MNTAEIYCLRTAWMGGYRFKIIQDAEKIYGARNEIINAITTVDDPRWHQVETMLDDYLKLVKRASDIYNFINGGEGFEYPAK